MAEQKIIITGINGFVGEHVAREFVERGYAVTGVGHDAVANQKVSDLLAQYIPCDLLNEDQVNHTLELGSVAAVIHLAGLANVGESFDQPARYMTANGIMTHNLLAKSLADNMRGRVLVISTGALYDPNQPLPLTEGSKTASNSPYAVGKLMVEYVVEYYRGRGVDAVIVRPFNHIGPGQGPGFILPDLHEQLSQATDSKRITVGNIETKRDYTDVRDIARAYADLTLAPSLEHSLYNVCSGKSLAGSQLLELLLATMSMSDVEVVVDESKIRPNDIKDIFGSSERLQNELGWQPQIPIRQTIEDFVRSR